MRKLQEQLVLMELNKQMRKAIEEIDVALVEELSEEIYHIEMNGIEE